MGTEDTKLPESPGEVSADGGEVGDASSRASTVDRVYGAIGILAILLAAFFLVRGGPRDDGSAAPGAVPRLEIVAPAAGAELAQPVTVRFDARTALEPDGGDPRTGRHVHVRVGRLEIMGSPGDVRPAGGTRYEWTLPPFPPGSHALRLYWSDARHRPLAEGASDSVLVRLR